MYPLSIWIVGICRFLNVISLSIHLLPLIHTPQIENSPVFILLGMVYKQNLSSHTISKILTSHLAYRITYNYF